MHKKFRFAVFLSIVPIITLSMTPSSLAIVNNVSVEWHSCVYNGLNLYYEINQVTNGNPSFGGQVLHPSDILHIKFVSDPSTQYNDLYNDQVPSWLEFYYQESQLNNSMFSLLETQILHSFIFPTGVVWDNGSQSSLEDFLLHINASLLENLEVRPANSGWEYVATFRNESMNHLYIEIITSMETGITNWITIGTDTYAYQFRFTGEMDYDELDEEENDDIPTSIGWNAIITKGTVLAWNITTFNQTAGDPFTIGGVIIKEGDILQFGFAKDPPTSVEGWMEPEESPDWINLFINSNKIDLNAVGDEGEFLLMLALPIEFKFDNGTVLGLEDFFDMYIGYNHEFIDYNRTKIDNLYHNVSWREEWQDGEISGWANHNLLNTIGTGITIKMAVEASEGSMIWEFLEEGSTIDPEKGETKTMESQYSVSLEYPKDELFTPGFEYLALITAFGLSILLGRTRKAE